MNKQNLGYFFLINFIYLLLPLCLPIISYSTQLDVEINKELIAEIATVGELIHAKCSPPDCLIIGPGRSPTPIIDFLETAYPGSTVGLPLTAFRYSQEDHSQNEIRNRRSARSDIKFYEPLTEIEEEKLFVHFDNIIKNKTDSINRIVVIDYTISGRSLLSCTEYLEKYLLKSGSKIKLEAVALVTKSHVDRYQQKILNRTQMPDLKIEHIVLPDNLGTLIHAEAFDNLAAYGQFDIRHDKQPWPANERERNIYLKNLCQMINSLK